MRDAFFVHRSSPLFCCFVVFFFGSFVFASSLLPLPLVIFFLAKHSETVKAVTTKRFPSQEQEN